MSQPRLICPIDLNRIKVWLTQCGLSPITLMHYTGIDIDTSLGYLYQEMWNPKPFKKQMPYILKLSRIFSFFKKILVLLNTSITCWDKPWRLTACISVILWSHDWVILEFIFHFALEQKQLKEHFHLDLWLLEFWRGPLQNQFCRKWTECSTKGNKQRNNILNNKITYD